jgi:glutamate synthase (NADPH/NADH) large chain
VAGQAGRALLEELIGRTDLLEILEGQTAKQHHLDLTPLLGSDHIPADKPQFCGVDRNPPFDKGLLAEKMVDMATSAINDLSGAEFAWTSATATVPSARGSPAKSPASTATRAWPRRRSPSASKGLPVRASAWNAGGLNMYLEGDANDYVGKGMTGGKLVIVPPKGSVYKTQDSAIIGNTCLYGATGGKLFAAGTAGERFAA